MQKQLIQLGISTILLFIFLGACSSSRTVTTTSEADITAAIDSNRWTFTVDRVVPQTGRSRQPNGIYTVVYTPNKLNVYLPYIGRAYSGADVFSTVGPLDFISKDFTTDKQLVKPGEWTIKIKPKDNTEVQLMIFTFFSNGTADLAVNMTNRSPISFSGRVDISK